MGNESGTWVMYGVEWDDSECIHTVDEAIEYINNVGFLPLFKNEIPGFSLEERTVPEYWWCENPKVDPWIWREIIARSGSLYLQIIAEMDMTLMLFMKMARLH